jgi:hypothetical protein
MLQGQPLLKKQEKCNQEDSRQIKEETGFGKNPKSKNQTCFSGP